MFMKESVEIKENKRKEIIMSVKISSLEIENIKRVKAITLNPTENGLTVLGGRNGQGKTSVLDSIAWALGGNKFAPSSPKREGSTIPPHLKVTLSNGLIVERSGKNSSLKVIDPNGNRGGQALLDSFISQFAIDLPRFLNSNNKEKANTLLQIIGVGDELFKLEKEEETVYNNRFAVGQIEKQKRGFVKEMPEYEGVPEEPISASELIKSQQSILAKNGENQRKRQLSEQYYRELQMAQVEYDRAKARLEEAQENAFTASKSAENLVDESTAELERQIAEIDDINRKVRANLDKEKVKEEADHYKQEYDTLTTKIEDIRKRKYDLLNNAQLPLEGLSIEKGELTYNGYKWDNMSGSEQLRVATAIIRKLNPNCGFVLIDKLEQMDRETLEDFGKWLEKEGLQAIATRVSNGDECSIIIEDGYSVNKAEDKKTEKKEWKAGSF